MNKGKVIAIVKFLFLVIIIIGLPVIIYFNHYSLIENLGSVEKVNAFITAHQTEGIFVYLLLQVGQIVIGILPGQVIQFAAGYMFHFPLGTFLTLIGAAIGTIIAFYIARILGKDAMYLFFGKERLDKYINKLNTKRAFILIFVLYLIPGLPKDTFAYAIGVSEMKFKPFLIVSLVGRAPAMMFSVMIGSMTHTGNYTGVIILSVLSVFFCIVGVLNYKKLHIWIDNIYIKLMK